LIQEKQENLIYFIFFNHSKNLKLFFGHYRFQHSVLLSKDFPNVWVETEVGLVCDTKEYNDGKCCSEVLFTTTTPRQQPTTGFAPHAQRALLRRLASQVQSAV
jgi:hypothetical protein